ncbi:MAG: hypothetical protein ABIA76_00330, partial [Candidatus Diapherotrites archaeon]
VSRNPELGCEFNSCPDERNELTGNECNGISCSENEECIGEETELTDGSICCLGECIEKVNDFPEFPENLE